MDTDLNDTPSDTPFTLTADFAPAGDQPQAIAKLIDGLQSGLAAQTLLGVTGSGQDLHHRQGHRGRAAADAGDRAQQDAGRAALRRVPRILSAQRGGVFRLLLRLLPARGLHAGLGHLHREGFLGQRAHRADAPVGDQGAAGAQGHDHRGHRVVDLRPGRSQGLPADGAAPQARRPPRPARAAAPAGRDAVHAQRHRPDPGLLPRARRRHRHLPGRVGARCDPRRAVRRRDRVNRALRSADRRGAREDAALHGVSRARTT